LFQQLSFYNIKSMIRDFILLLIHSKTAQNDLKSRTDLLPPDNNKIESANREKRIQLHIRQKDFNLPSVYNF